MNELEVQSVREAPVEEAKATVSEGALGASRVIEESIASGRQPTKEEMATLAEAIKADLAEHGVSLTPKDEKEWRKSTNGLFKKAAQEPGTIDKKTQNGFSEFLQWLPQYSATVKDVSDKYGFSTRAGPKLRLWQSVMGALALIDGAGPTYLAWRWVNKKFQQDRWEHHQSIKTPKRIRFGADYRWVTEGVSPTRGALRQEAQNRETLGIPLGNDPVLKNARAERKLMERLPLLFSLSVLPMGHLRGKAVEQFQKQMGFVQKSLNERIANTLLMRDLEFMHDATATELWNRMERGRWAVTTLIAEHHINIMPRLLATTGAILSRVWEDPLVAGLSLIRLPFIISAAKAHIDESIKWGKEEGKKRAEVERMIGSILVSAEVVKTDDVEEAATKLREALDERDEVLRGKERSLTESEKGHVRVTKTFDTAAPVASALWRLVQNGGWSSTALTDRLKSIPSMSRADWIIKGSDVLESVLSSSRTQDILKANITALVGLYTGTLRAAVIEARAFEEFLGSYESLDRPDGPKEQERVPVESLPNLAISVKNVSYKHILHDVSLDIPQGSFLTIKGKRGSGKTTLLQHFMGLLGGETNAVTYGGVAVDGIKQFGEHAFQTAIGYATQEPQILPHMTIRENLLLWSRRTVTDDRLKEVLLELGMEKFADKLHEKHAHFSGGEKRSIGIARALIKDPNVLFLDEPTSNLDQQSAKQVMEIIQNLRKKRPEMTVVAVTHDPIFETIAEQVIDMKEINKAPVLTDSQVLIGSSK